MVVHINFEVSRTRITGGLEDILDPVLQAANKVAATPTGTWTSVFNNNAAGGTIIARINTDDTPAQFAVGVSAPSNDNTAYVFSACQRGSIAIPVNQRLYIKTGGTSVLTSTREYAAGVRIGVGSASAQSSALAATEVLLHASTRCFVKAGADPTAVANGDSIPLEAGEKFHMRIQTGMKIAVIRDTADGFLHITPVA